MTHHFWHIITPTWKLDKKKGHALLLQERTNRVSFLANITFNYQSLQIWELILNGWIFSEEMKTKMASAEFLGVFANHMNLLEFQMLTLWDLTLRWSIGCHILLSPYKYRLLPFDLICTFRVLRVTAWNGCLSTGENCIARWWREW